MKKIISVLLLSIFIILNVIGPTSVFADVVIGDNDEYVANENAIILGRKIALMESIPNLLNSGVTSLTISNSADLDEYLDALWDELGDALDYLSGDDWVGDISEALRNEAIQNIDNYLSYTENRGNWFSELLNNPTTTLLKTYVIGNNLPKVEYKPNYDTLNTFKRLSRINQGSPQPDPDFSFISHINEVYFSNNSSYTGKQDFYTSVCKEYTNPSQTITQFNPKRATAFFVRESPAYHTTGYWQYGQLCAYVPLTINLYVDQNDGTVSATYSSTQLSHFWDGSYGSNNSVAYYWSYGTNTIMQQMGNVVNPTYHNSWQTSFGGLSTAINYIYSHFANINLYVDGSPWVLMDDSGINPSMDIDGELKIYGNDNPVTYNITTGTQLDYDALYDTIYNAIINALPIDQQDITYYDSHDTIYSPTTINNYYGDTDGEDDFIESIIDYALVPKFDTAMLAPIEAPLVNGVSILNVSVGYGVIPNDILWVLGGLCVLGLFVLIINRMLE